MDRGSCSACAALLPAQSNFCPSCGKAQGAVERPQTADTGNGWVEFIDKSWDFFASTRVAAFLILLIAIASIAGSLIEQEGLYQDWRPPHLYYPIRYGDFWGKVYMTTGLTHAYTSLWFAGIVLLIVISLIICSFQRVIPLHKVLQKPQVWKLPSFVRRQHVFHETDGTLESMQEKLKKKGYHVIRDRECLYADKGRLSRYGPYIIHIGLLVVAFAAFTKGIPGWDTSKDALIADGQTVKIQDTEFALTNHSFVMETYPSGMPSRFATDTTLIENGKEVARAMVEVNKPMVYNGWEVFQTSFRQEPGTATIKVMAADTKQEVSRFTIDLRQPETIFPIGDRVKLVVRSYYHDFIVDPETGQPTNASYEVKNPVMLADFETTDRAGLIGRAALIVLANAEPVFEGPLYLEVDQVETRWYTALRLRRDKTAPYMFTGLGIVLLGMSITFFMFHWQVWVRFEDGKLLIGARAYKNKFGLKQEMKRLLGLPAGEGQLS